MLDNTIPDESRDMKPDTTAPGPLVFTVMFDIVEGGEEEFVRLVSDVIDKMRHEPTFISTTLGRDPNAPGRFYLFEQWADREEFIQVQLKRDYRTPYETRLPRLLRRPRAATEWHQLRSDHHSALLPERSASHGG